MCICHYCDILRQEDTALVSLTASIAKSATVMWAMASGHISDPFSLRVGRPVKALVASD